MEVAPAHRLPSWNFTAFLLKQCISCLHRVLPSFHIEDSPFCQKQCIVKQMEQVFYHRSNLALCFLHWLLTALYLDLGWTFQNSVLPQIFQISKSHSIILYPRFFLNLKSLKPNRLRILEWFPFDKFSASVYKTGWPLVKQFSNPQCTPWLLLSRRKKKILLQQASLVVSLVAQKVKSACDVGDPGSILVSGRPPGKMNGNPLQYSCLENSMDRGAWRAPWCHKELDMAEGLTFSLSNELWLQQFCDWVLCGF